ncbi:hypothetical protein BJV82DRAFT_616321 [Fennellomyces sp. T-0311]|nr:hypothetical protein BJV82DRAFT_616321 [Fennellomyces sp. T-0311]
MPSLFFISIHWITTNASSALIRQRHSMYRQSKAVECTFDAFGSATLEILLNIGLGCSATHLMGWTAWVGSVRLTASTLCYITDSKAFGIQSFDIGTDSGYRKDKK